MAEPRLPHALRFSVFLLRLALGVNFFYVGWSALFDQPLIHKLGGRSLGDLYAWIGAPFGGAALGTALAWACIAIGVCLIAGLVTRLAAVAGIALTVASYAPSVTLAPPSFTQFANDAVLAIAAFLVLLFANAGDYLGLDRFIHIHLAARHKK